VTVAGYPRVASDALRLLSSLGQCGALEVLGVGIGTSR
jgi:hypothetical protein